MGSLTYSSQVPHSPQLTILRHTGITPYAPPFEPHHCPLAHFTGWLRPGPVKFVPPAKLPRSAHPFNFLIPLDSPYFSWFNFLKMIFRRASSKLLELAQLLDRLFDRWLRFDYRISSSFYSESSPRRVYPRPIQRNPKKRRTK